MHLIISSAFRFLTLSPSQKITLLKIVLSVIQDITFIHFLFLIARNTKNQKCIFISNIIYETKHLYLQTFIFLIKTHVLLHTLTTIT